VNLNLYLNNCASFRGSLRSHSNDPMYYYLTICLSYVSYSYIASRLTLVCSSHLSSHKVPNKQQKQQTTLSFCGCIVFVVFFIFVLYRSPASHRSRCARLCVSVAISRQVTDRHQHQHQFCLQLVLFRFLQRFVRYTFHQHALDR